MVKRSKRCWWWFAAVAGLLGVLDMLARRAALGACRAGDPLQLAAENIPFITLDDGRLLEYFVAGDTTASETVLCMHGSLQTGQTICRIVDSALKSRGLRALCPTQPGHGYSGWTEAPMALYNRDIAQLADALGIQRFYGVAGWSAGGLPAAVIASAMPDRVGSVLLVVATPPNPSWYDYSLLGKMYLWMAAYTRVNEMLTHFMVLPMLRKNCTSFFQLPNMDDDAATLTTRLNATELCADMLRAVGCGCERGYSSTGSRWFRHTPLSWSNISKHRVDIVVAERDNFITPLAARRYHEHIAGSRLWCASGVDHAAAGLDVSSYIGALWGENPQLPAGECKTSP